MLQIDTYIAPDKYGGKGVFAAVDVPKGTIVWRYDARFTVYIPIEEYRQCSQERVDYLARFAYPVYLPEERPVPLIGLMCNLDNARFMNHDDKPNTGHPADDSDLNIALTAIRQGDELTCNYFEFDPGNVLSSMGLTTCKDFLFDLAS